MTRQRDIPNIQYRGPNQVNLTLPIQPGVEFFELRGASRLNDAYGNVAGVGGGGTLPITRVLNGGQTRSKSIQSRRLPAVEESGRRLSRIVFDPDDFATPVNPAASYLPPDDNTIFLRVAPFNIATSAFMSEGPIMIVPPPDFFSTKEPLFTVTGIAPNMNIGAFPPNIPDVMPPESMNFLLPAYSTTVNFRNLDALLPVFVSFHPGAPPTVVPPLTDVGLTGAGVPEFFVAAPNGNPWFTVRVAVVNSA